MRWGLVPSFTKPDAKPNFFTMFNARSETVATKSIFSRLLKGRRCLVCAQGFYEWKQEHKIKQPYYIHTDEPLMVFAGLYDTWATKDEEGQDYEMATCTILTCDSSKRLKWLHDRQPVILPNAAACKQWLEEPWSALSDIIAPYSGSEIAWHAVTPAMNKTSYKEADCAAPLAQKGLGQFFQKAKEAPSSQKKADAPGDDSVVKCDEVKPTEVKAELCSEADAEVTAPLPKASPSPRADQDSSAVKEEADPKQAKVDVCIAEADAEKDVRTPTAEPRKRSRRGQPTEDESPAQKSRKSTGQSKGQTSLENFFGKR